MNWNLFYRICAVFISSVVFDAVPPLVRIRISFFSLALSPNWEKLSGAGEVRGLFDSSRLLGVETKENKPFLIQFAVLINMVLKSLDLFKQQISSDKSPVTQIQGSCYLN